MSKVEAGKKEGKIGKSMINITKKVASALQERNEDE